MRISTPGWLVYLAVVAAIIFVGWKQPLRYRFLTQAEIAEIERPAPPPTPPPAPATPPPGAWMNDPAQKNPLGPTRGSR